MFRWDDLVGVDVVAENVSLTFDDMFHGFLTLESVNYQATDQVTPVVVISFSLLESS
jgi:hypothetical protein